MAGWRQAVALAMTGEEIEALTALSRSRTEPAGRVSRAAMLLGYREKPSFFAVGRRHSSRGRTNRQAGCRGQRCCSATGRSHRSLPWDEDLACIIRRCSAASSERRRVRCRKSQPFLQYI